MPVLPLVGSTMTVSRSIFPSRSADSIIATPMRSFTLESGLKNSHLHRTVASVLGMMRLIRTSGVPPMVSVMSLKIRPSGLRGIGRFLSLHISWGRVDRMQGHDVGSIDSFDLQGRVNDRDGQAILTAGCLFWMLDVDLSAVHAARRPRIVSISMVATFY